MKDTEKDSEPDLPDLYDSQGNPIMVTGTVVECNEDEKKAIVKSVARMQALRNHLKKGAVPERG